MKNNLTKELQDRIIRRRIKTIIIQTISIMVLICFVIFCGAGAFAKQMKIQDCEDFKNYEAQYPNSVSEEQIEMCEIIGINLK